MPTRAERLVVDTNVLISAALRSDTPPRQVLDAVPGMHPFRSIPILDPAAFLAERA